MILNDLLQFFSPLKGDAYDKFSSRLNIVNDNILTLLYKDLFSTIVSAPQFHCSSIINQRLVLSDV